MFKKLEIIFALLSIVIPLIALSFSAWKYVDIRESELRQQRYENYHSLVSKLAAAESNEEQLAVVFEFRNYPEYKSVSLRILSSLKKTWSRPESKDEISRTIEALQAN
ncbi:MAG: hypothetical protein methR_P3029 [Methyloprofundus sp.]|nr:MAG: hypothetical protein methR_P3000 [Methyloprofundus sp.]BCG65204.1 MAG: hypothetical protein methR_P3029 [Methyloprofundus sp.]